MIILFGGIRSFFSVSASVCDSRNWNSRSNSFVSSAVFEGRLKRPSPCRTHSAPGRDRVRGLSETIEKCAKFFIWAVYARAIIGSWHMQSLNEKNIWENILFPSWHHFQINWLLISSPPHFFRGHTSKCLAYCAHRTTDCCVVAFRYRISRLNTFVRAFSLSSRGAVPYTTLLHPVSVLILHPSEIYNYNRKINQGIKQVKC